MRWNLEEDRADWELEQRRLDREWYNMDEGYNEETNPFANVSEEYAQKKVRRDKSVISTSKP